jgi:hypothetical protein
VPGGGARCLEVHGGLHEVHAGHGGRALQNPLWVTLKLTVTAYPVLMALASVAMMPPDAAWRT